MVRSRIVYLCIDGTSASRNYAPITRQYLPDRLAVATDVDQVDKPLILAARPDFQHCPLEILSEIVSYLDLGDVLRLRQVCDILSIWQR